MTKETDKPKPSAILHALEVEESKLLRRKGTIIKNYDAALATVNADLGKVQKAKVTAMEEQLKLIEQEKEA